jgi:SnoaL-like domain
MNAEDGIRRSLAQYCQLFDSKQWESLGEIFAEDASITSRRGTFRSRGEVVRDLQHAMTGDYHGTLFTSNSLIAVDGDTASAFSDFMEVEDNKILAVGTYADTFVRSGDVWLFTSKEIRLK